MLLTKIFSLIGIFCHGLIVRAQNFTNVDLQLAAYLESNNLTNFNVTANRAQDSDDIKITALSCTIAVSTIHGSRIAAERTLSRTSADSWTSYSTAKYPSLEKYNICTKSLDIGHSSKRQLIRPAASHQLSH
jgi:hypothetical protein